VTLRRRMALAAAGAVALTVLVVAAVVYVVVRHDLRGQIDSSLHQSAQRAVGLERIGPAPEPRQVPSGSKFLLERPFGGSATYFEIVTPSGKSLRRGPLLVPVTERTKQVAAGTGSEFIRDATVRGTHVRILTAPDNAGNAVVVARPLTEVDHDLVELRWILAFVILSGILAGGGLGMLVASGVLRPVRRLTGAAEHVAQTSDLSQRIELSGSGDELDRLSAAFNEMMVTLEASQQAQRQLVADASHELRTPLTSIRTNVDLLARARDLPPEEREAVLSAARSQLEELTVLIGDLVDLARDGRPDDGELEDLRLDDIVVDAVARAQTHAPEMRFLVSTEPTMIRAARGRVDRAVSNLLDNAVKWSNTDGEIEVTVAGGEVMVRDHGPGIPDEDLPFVFDRFYRAAHARRLPGSGLGLAIVRDVAERFGGSVSAANAGDGGACLRLRMPAV
jgi:two-component system, OmpR family, sensor histidine kinase MprB